jgi:uncharacterized protein with HEPN domain
LAQELETTQTSLTATRDMLTTKSSALDTTVIWEQETKNLTRAEEKLKAVEKEMKTQGQSLESA